ncbi:MAG: CoA transferase subunit [Solirubrobacterales bacterium]|nr:CoA transferase subunit [Solirubrobacterales bacterium]
MASESTLFLGGMLLARRPVAFCRALVLAAVQKLTVVTFTAGVETEVLLDGGCLDVVRTTYAGLEIYGPSLGIRAAAEDGVIELVDETEFTIAAGLQAAVLGLPWFPSTRALVGTDYPDLRPDIGRLVDPASGRELLTLPPIRPDVAVIHAPWADSHGNAILRTGLAVDHAAACASAVTIVTAERVLAPDELRALGEADLLAFQVDHVVEAPDGARPTSCLPHYEHDRVALIDLAEAR